MIKKASGKNLKGKFHVQYRISQVSDFVNLVNVANAGPNAQPLPTMQLRVRFPSVILFAFSVLFLVSHNVTGQWSVAKLSSARLQPSAATIGTKVLIAGGISGADPAVPLDVVDIYDDISGTWSFAKLSVARSDMASTTCQGKAFFGGGYNGTGYSDVVDVYDLKTGSWTTLKLSRPRTQLCAASVGTKVIFAGGIEHGFDASDVVDIYDVETGKWSLAKLSAPRCRLAAATVGSKILIGGGITNNDEMSLVVDVYDDKTKQWTQTKLSDARRDLSAVAVGTKVIFAGGENSDGETSRVDIYDDTDASWSTYQLSAGRFDMAATTALGKVVFAGGHVRSTATTSDVVDIYDDNTSTWSTSKLSRARNSIAAAAVGNKIFFAGGWINKTERTTATIDVFNLEHVRDTKPPSVLIEYDNGGIMDEQGLVSLHVKVSDETPLKSLVINGEQLIGNDTRFVVDKHLILKSGSILSISAIDVGGLEKSVDHSIVGKSGGAEANAIKHNYHALLFAVDQYRDRSIESLANPIKDATELQAILTQQYGFEANHVTLVRNPTLSDIYNSLRAVRDKMTAEDLLLIFYAGHGYQEPKTNIGYWLPSDASKDDGSGWFRNSALVEDIRSINTKHILLVTDACFAGSIFKTRSGINNAGAAYHHMMKHNSRKAITSGAQTPVPDNSVFMHYLLKVLKENRNEYLDSEEIYHQVREYMKNNSAPTPVYGEIKDVGDEGGVFVFHQKRK